MFWRRMLDAASGVAGKEGERKDEGENAAYILVYRLYWALEAI